MAPGPRTPATPRVPRSPRPARAARPAPRAAAPRRRPVPLLLVLVAFLAIGALLGWMGREANNGAFRGSWEFSRLGGPWLVGAFAAGAIGGWRRRGGGLLLGVVGGAIAIALGSLAYYGISIWWEHVPDARRAAKLGVGWAAAGIVIGGAVGLLGALWATSAGGRARDALRGAALGTLGGLLMGESIALLWVWDSEALRTMAALEGLAGAAVVAVGSVGRSWRWILAAVVLAAITASVAPIATTMVRDALRTIGWAGA